MSWKALTVCAALFGSVLTLRASDPMTCKEIAMLLRNGEDQQFIIDDTARRKLLEPLSPAEEADLISLGAKPALLQALRAPEMIAAPQTAAEYQSRVEQQKSAAMQQQREEELSAAKQAAAPPAAEAKGNEFKGKPLDLKFTAADGSPVDLANLRGKVVLIDFWATWCGPCMKEVPEVVATYKKYHDKGFEIIGISLDHDKDAMLRTTQQKEMTWQQYFDGKGWNNDIATTFHIRAIPSMWLVDKKGTLVNTEARGHLDDEVTKLLDE